MRKSMIWSRGPMASNHVYHAIGLCKICKRVIYKEDLVDEELYRCIDSVIKSMSIDLLIAEDKAIKFNKEYLCLKHKGVKELCFGK
jgi:hypothetical protein